MKLMQSITILSLTAALLFAQGGGEKKDEQLQQIAKTGKKSAKLLLKTLGSNMKKNMKAGGPMQALDFCSKEAYNLTEKVNKALPKGITVKRVTMQERNPANKAEADEAKVLQALQALKDANVVLPKKIIQKVDQDTYKYYKPLVIKKQVCLKCHGDVKNKALAKAIKERYTNDKAVHYKMGDLRGAIVVTITK